MYPDNLKYTKTHEWVKAEGNLARVGITDHAQSELGDVVFIELPQTGATIQSGDSFGSIESVKTVSDLVSPISGNIVQVNSELLDKPELINEDPYGSGWLAEIEMSNMGELEGLMSAEDYENYIQEA